MECGMIGPVLSAAEFRIAPAAEHMRVDESHPFGPFR